MTIRELASVLAVSCLVGSMAWLLVGGQMNVVFPMVKPAVLVLR